MLIDQFLYNCSYFYNFPMHQYASGYVAMGDNPVSMVDPSGMMGYDNLYRRLAEMDAVVSQERWRNALEMDQEYGRGIYFDRYSTDYISGGMGSGEGGGSGKGLRSSFTYEAGNETVTVSDGATATTFGEDGSIKENTAISYNSDKGERGAWVQTSGTFYIMTVNGRTVRIAASEATCIWVSGPNIPSDKYGGIPSVFPTEEPLYNDGFDNQEMVGLGITAVSSPFKVTTVVMNKLTGSAGNANAVKFGRSLGTKFGIINVGTNIIFAVSDRNFTMGDGAKVLLSGVTFIPYVGWAYGIIDTGVLLFTGTSVTDRVGGYVEEHWGNGPSGP